MSRRAQVSAGLLLCRWRAPVLEYFLVHPGGPYFANKDAGAWSLPKGLLEPGEAPLTTALREFGEETGFPQPPPPYLPLGEITQKGGKRVLAFSALGDADPGALRSNTFELEWPPRSGRRQDFPEVDRGAWYPLAEAKLAINAAQIPLLERARTAWFTLATQST